MHLKSKFAGLTLSTVALTCFAGAAQAAYDTPGTTVSSSTLNQQGSSTTTNTISAGSTGSSLGGGSKLFGGRLGRSTQRGSLDEPDSRDLFGAGARGFSAQERDPKFGVWGQYGFSHYKQDQTTIAGSGDTHVFVAGGDYRFNNWFLAGLSAGYERGDNKTTFNNGKITTNAGLVAPYAVFQLIEGMLFLDANAGYAAGGMDTERSNGSITGNTDFNRFFASSNLTANLERGNWQFRPGAGLVWARQEIDAYRESNATAVPRNVDHFGRMRVGSQIGYQFTRWQPYVLADYEYDFKFDYARTPAGVTQPVEHRSGALLGGGAIFSFTNSLTGGVQFTTRTFRSDYSEYSANGTIRYAF